MFLGYGFRFKDRRQLSLQINIANLFDETDAIVARYQLEDQPLTRPQSLRVADGTLYRPFRVALRGPRALRLIANLSF